MNAIISDATTLAVGWTLLHFLWQGAAVAAIVGILRVVVRRPQARHAMSVGALAVCALLPAITCMLVLPLDRAPDTYGDVSAYASVVPSAAQRVVPPRPVDLTVQPVVSTSVDTSMSLVALRRYVPLIALLWVVGVACMAVRLTGGCWTTHRLRRTGISPLPEVWQARVNQLVRDLGLRRRVDVVVSSVAAVPMVVGVLRPMVLMPVATLLGLTPAQLETILLHELMHVRRYDGAVILLQRLVETVLFYHPAVWWISSCVHRDRELCCDDAVAARVDARTYVRALTSLEQLRAPVLAAAATEGALLARVRRLLAPQTTSAGASGVAPRITLSNVIGTLALVSLTVGVLGTSRSSSATAEDAMASSGEVLLKGARAGDSGSAGFSSIVDAYIAALAAGGDEWSVPDVAAAFGYPFHFALKAGAVSHDHNCNIETWWFFGRMNDLGWKTESFEDFTRAGDEPSGKLPELREQAWKAVTAGIDRGMPAIAWSPREGHDFSPWGLLVGYNAEAKTYQVSHAATDSVYTIPYDGFGQVWFHVIVFTERTDVDLRAVDIATLRHAVEFSKGLRYTVEESKNCCEVAATGFDAYQLWLDALEAGEFDASAARSHAWQLMHTRRLAAQYTHAVAVRFDGAVASRLTSAWEHYTHAGELGEQLLELVTPWSNRAWTAAEVEEARRLLDLAMQWERGAVMYLEAALHKLGEEIPGEPLNSGVATLQQERPAKIDVDVAPTEPHRGTTLAASLEPVMQTLGLAGWSPARLQGVLGHAFHFQMADGGGDVYHDNLDWGVSLQVLADVAQYRTYEATKESSAAERATAMRDARDAVRASLARGVPALVWNPRSVTQREQHHPGGHGVCWGIIVGYDEARELFSIRHPFVWQGDYTIGYDEMGETDGAEWFNVMVFDGAKDADDAALHLMALENAVSFADGSRLGEHKWSQGFDAYELWLAAFASADLTDAPTKHHANMLRFKRELAAEYLHDLAGMFHKATEPLEQAASHYESEHALLEELSDLVTRARARGFTSEDRAEAGRLLRGALAADRAAVADIQAALVILRDS